MQTNDKGEVRTEEKDQPKRRPYSPPKILTREKLESLANICDKADDAACRIRPHADAVDHLRGLDGLAVVGDEDELRIPAQLTQHVDEAHHVGLVQHGINFV